MEYVLAKSLTHLHHQLFPGVPVYYDEHQQAWIAQGNGRDCPQAILTHADTETEESGLARLLADKWVESSDKYMSQLANTYVLAKEVQGHRAGTPVTYSEMGAWVVDKDTISNSLTETRASALHRLISSGIVEKAKKYITKNGFINIYQPNEFETDGIIWDDEAEAKEYGNKQKEDYMITIPIEWKVLE